MYSRCEKCEFFDVDYVFDDESNEEMPVSQCRKDNAINLKLKGFLCPYFKERIYTPCIEKYTKCDKCVELSKCIKNGICMEITHCDDFQRHYTISFGAICDKSGRSEL